MGPNDSGYVNTTHRNDSLSEDTNIDNEHYLEELSDDHHSQKH